MEDYPLIQSSGFEPISVGKYLRYWLTHGTYATYRGIINDVVDELTCLRFWDVDELSYILYKKDLRKFKKRLSIEEEQSLLREKCKGCRVSFNILVEKHLGFVIYIARKYMGRGVPLNDLISEGNIGLINAVTRMDPDRGFRLATFAEPYIRASILAALNKYAKQIYLPSPQTTRYDKIKRYISKYILQFGEPPSYDMISEHLKMSFEEVTNTISTYCTEVSLDLLLSYFDET